MQRKKHAVTIQDVAKAAKVSVSTVSRVLNGKVDVANETQERILSVIAQLGYTSNLAARSMRSRRKNLIGLVVPDIGFPYSIEIMKGINRAIAQSKFDLLVYTTGDVRKNGSALHEQHYVSLLNNSVTDGVIIVASAASDFITNAPIVAVDPHIVNPNYPYVQGTNYQGALEIMEYLLGLGHRRIGFINGRPEIASAQRRLEGYKDALKAANIKVDESLIVPGDFVQPAAYKSTLQLLSLKDPPTAIFAANDQSAMGVYQAAEELGFRIPEDLSVVGFDNISEAKYMGLTTMDQSLDEMGYAAVQMLIKLIQKEPVETEAHKIPTKLIVRTSCSKPRH
ncbi:MAG: LacI family transcriptional regulator [Chloroflexi bacterium]|nr:LacI family transcriptional regulator [Chloroflexota bacterium]MCA2001940.1 LacI family transcriptional regulator [Chloroflexota bacterium]